MAKNKLTDLRDHLFETIEALKDSENPMDLSRALAISEVAQTIINSAKVEVDLVKAVSASAPGSPSFFNLPEVPGGLPELSRANQGLRNSGLLRGRQEG